MGRLDGKRALVTGAAGGIGSAVASCLASEGAHVMLVDIDGEGCRRVSDSILAFGGSSEAFTADLTDELQIVALFASLRDRGGLDILVNIAGGDAEPAAGVEDTDAEKLHLNLDMNLVSCILCSREAVRLMKPAGYGRIVNMSSLVWRGSPNQFTYSATKGAICAYTRSIAMALGPHNITANAIAPALVDVEAFPRALGPERWQVLAEATAARYPLGRIATPDDVAKAVLFFASDDAAFITGQILEVAGGARL